jgi:DNA end-binding protein Ku
MEALRRSLEQSQRGRSRRNGSRNGYATSKLTKDELNKRAAKLGIEGRSKMTKDELAKAVASAK